MAQMAKIPVNEPRDEMRGVACGERSASLLPPFKGKHKSSKEMDDAVLAEAKRKFIEEMGKPEGVADAELETHRPRDLPRAEDLDD
jgi:hypothetical protein